MNPIFDFSRFKKLFLTEYGIGSRKYLTSFLTIMGIIAGAFLFFTWTSGDTRYEYAIVNPTDPMYDTVRFFFWLGLIFVCCYGASGMFSMMDNKRSAISALMLPASTLEKYAMRLLVLVPIAVIAYVVAFEIVDLARCLFARLLYPDSICIRPYGFGFIHDTKGENALFLMALFVLQSFLALGSAIWPKRGGAKMFLALFAVGFVLMNLSFMMAHLLITPGYIYGWGVNGFDDDVKVLHTLFYVASCAMIIINYTIAYFRFKEMEIVNRW